MPESDAYIILWSVVRLASMLNHPYTACSGLKSARLVVGGTCQSHCLTLGHGGEGKFSPKVDLLDH